MGTLRVLQLPPTVQKHFRPTDFSKLSLGLTVCQTRDLQSTLPLTNQAQEHKNNGVKTINEWMDMNIFRTFCPHHLAKILNKHLFKKMAVKRFVEKCEMEIGWGEMSTCI